MYKKLIILLLAGVILTLGSNHVVKVYADNSSVPNTLIQRLAQKFNVSESDVQGVFEDYRSERILERQSELDEKLTKAVQEGTLTQEQKDQLLAMLTTWHEQKGDFSTLSKEDRHDQMLIHRDELRAWAEANGLDIYTLHTLLGSPNTSFGHRGRRF